MRQHWKLVLSYDGSHFHGWQVQPGLATVQGTLSDALLQLFSEAVLPQGSGRTDAGVHALAQVASFSLEADVPEANLLRAINRILPASIRVLTASKVDSNFHARHSARGKRYEYRIFERRRMALKSGPRTERICSPFLAPYVWDCRWPLSVERMERAAAHLCGVHDFSSFAASDPEHGLRDDESLQEATRGQKVNPVKTIWQSAWTRENDLLIYRVHGSGFLHHMVRNFVGTLVDIGRGSMEPEDVPTILSGKDRKLAGPTAPARGLFLHSVEYHPSYREPGEPV